MTTNHTPGPWYAEPQVYDSSSFYIRGSDSKGNRLTWGKGAVAHIPRSRVMPMQANARLIAAAPELLSAALAARDVLATAIRANWEGATDDDISNHVTIKRLDNAIDKATGA